MLTATCMGCGKRKEILLNSEGRIQTDPLFLRIKMPTESKSYYCFKRKLPKQAFRSITSMKKLHFNNTFYSL